ncbi:hypothetical protein N7U49_35665 [Streptomyces sp. AD2-2]|nr:hypothetical protein N7U49_35665 [Streptomyces sp. AD2-2]
MGAGPGSTVLRGSAPDSADGAVTVAAGTGTLVSVPVNRSARLTGTVLVRELPPSSTRSIHWRMSPSASAQAMTPFWIRPPTTLGGQSTTSAERTDSS